VLMGSMTDISGLCYRDLRVCCAGGERGNGDES
jgi:hypothetical protein